MIKCLWLIFIVRLSKHS